MKKKKEKQKNIYLVEEKGRLIGQYSRPDDLNEKKLFTAPTKDFPRAIYINKKRPEITIKQGPPCWVVKEGDRYVAKGKKTQTKPQNAQCGIL